MAVADSRADPLRVPTLAHESLYVGIDVGKQFHVAGFVATTLLARHGRFESCPALKFDQAREGFRQLADRIRAYVPLQQCHVLVEQTGHYHHALVEYLLELGAAVYVCHVQARPLGLLKSDRRDALALANQLFNQLEKGVQAGEQSRSVRRAVPATESALLLKGLMRHRYELSHERIRRKNKLTAIADQLFPEFATVFRDPNRPIALALRERLPTPHAVASASLGELEAVRRRNHPSREQLRRLQELAGRSIGVRDPIRQRALVFEQGQLIRELRLLEEHLGQIDDEARRLVEGAREGRILTSIPGIGTIPAGAMLAAIGHIDNFRSAAALKAYFGWAPAVRQSGASRYQAALGAGGTRPMKQMLYLVALKAVRPMASGSGSTSAWSRASAPTTSARRRTAGG